MHVSDFLPAAGLGLLSAIALTAAQVLPVGQATVLVRLSGAAPEAALVAAGATDAALVAVPEPGFAVLHGDAARIRAVLGLAPLWKGDPPCSTRL